MAKIKPFRALRPVPEKIGEVASVPYDVVSSEEAREMAKGNPWSFLHVNKPEIDLDPSIDLYDPRVYAKGAENLKRLRDEGILIQDEKPCFYVYTLIMGDHEQTGIVAGASVDDYIHDRIKKHEYTRPDKENDRMTHIDSLNAQTGPVFLTYRAQDRIDTLIARAKEQPPVYSFTGAHQVRHIVYRMEDPVWIRQIMEAFAAIDSLYVADGHHRSAAAVRVREARMAKNPNPTGEEEYNYFLSVIFPDREMKILDYNRVVKDLNGLDKERFLSRIQENFELEPYSACCTACGGCRDTAFRPAELHQFGMYLDGQWYALTARQDRFDASDPIRSLDVSILQENLLAPILGIENPRTDKRIDFVGGIRGLVELERLVNQGKYEVAFALYPTSIQQLLAVADAGKVMPPKSTWFEPKLASGVAIHLLDE